MPYSSPNPPCSALVRPADFGTAESPAPVAVTDPNRHWVAAAVAAHHLIRAARIRLLGTTVAAWTREHGLSRKRWSALLNGAVWLQFDDVGRMVEVFGHSVLSTWPDLASELARADPQFVSPPPSPRPELPRGLRSYAGRPVMSAGTTLRAPVLLGEDAAAVRATTESVAHLAEAHAADSPDTLLAFDAVGPGAVKGDPGGTLVVQLDLHRRRPEHPLTLGSYLVVDVTGLDDERRPAQVRVLDLHGSGDDASFGISPATVTWHEGAPVLTIEHPE